MRNGMGRAIGIICLTALGGGCGITKPVRYYALSSTQSQSAEEAPTKVGVIGIMQVALPEYLDRPQIVTSGTGNRLVFADFDRWAEPLAEGTARVLTADLSALLPRHEVRHRGWLDKSLLDYAVNVEIVHFEGVLGGDAKLSVVWSVRQKGNEQTTHTRRTDYAAPTHNASIDAFALALSKTIGMLAKDIANVIQENVVPPQS